LASHAHFIRLTLFEIRVKLYAFLCSCVLQRDVTQEVLTQVQLQKKGKQVQIVKFNVLNNGPRHSCSWIHFVRERFQGWLALHSTQTRCCLWDLQIG
jgi:hypothetical protein